MSKSPDKTSRQAILPLGDLLLDPNNPRFGRNDESSSAESNRVQERILKHIVSTFEVNDILSSLAVNGYFQSEPLVCQEYRGGKYIVKEGNRRLAACLILSGDKRAAEHKKRADRFKNLRGRPGKSSINEIPATIFPAGENKEILSYLGVRHISSTMPWDSYAKATWVAQVVEASKLEVSEIAAMIGDRNQTISRMLEGYYFVQQMVDEGKFDPESSNRRGRGSMTAYPFSWVYEIIRRSTVREFLGLAERKDAPTEDPKNPVPKEHLDDGGLVLKSMFGNGQGQSAAIHDSRQLGDLADVFGDHEKIRLLEDGKSVEEINELMQPVKEQLAKGFARTKDIQGVLLARLTQRGISQGDARSLTDTASDNRNLAVRLAKDIREIAFGGDEEK